MLKPKKCCDRNPYIVASNNGDAFHIRCSSCHFEWRVEGSVIDTIVVWNVAWLARGNPIHIVQDAVTEVACALNANATLVSWHMVGVPPCAYYPQVERLHDVVESIRAHGPSHEALESVHEVTIDILDRYEQRLRETITPED